MANRNNRSILRARKNITDIANGISGNMDALHRSTYMSSPQQSLDLDDLNDRINTSIDNIVTRNKETVGIPSVSQLYSRLAETSKRKGDVAVDLDTVFDSANVSDDLYGMFMSNKYLAELDAEIDTICKYMPKLEEALAVQKDCVLSADHFSKDYLTFEYPAGKPSAVISERFKDMKLKYKLVQLVEEIYDDTSKYGEKFIYRVPYSTAIGKLLKRKQEDELIYPDSNFVAPNRGFHESTVEEENTINKFVLEVTHDNFRIINESGDSEIKESNPCYYINESANTSNKNIPDGKDVTKQVSTDLLKKDEKVNLCVEICTSGVIESFVEEQYEAYKKKQSITNKSLASIHENALNEAKDHHVDASGGLTMGSVKYDDRIIANDGLVNGEGKKDLKEKNFYVKAPGCVVRKLKRDQVLPVYIDDMCMGYYYFEIRANNPSDSFVAFKNVLGDPLTNLRGDNPNAFNSIENSRQDETIKYVSAQLSKFINKQFVNNNQDLAKEIYMILKYNDLFNSNSSDSIRITFVPPEDMVHFYFKLDPITHRGISDLDKSLIPAKMYTSLYVTSTIGTLTRGQDKRVYYVKQTVDTNISQNLLNTIAQIKQGNFGIRQFQSINSILNITGRFNDFVIPTNASGDAPIQFEVMPGQDIQTPTELMEALEEMAINSTGIPIEIIQARQSIDYAMQLTMSSSKVLRFCYKRQELFEALLTELISPIYNYEYNESVTISVKLPPPTFINITNTNQLIDNTKNFVQSIVEVEMANEENDKLKNLYTNLLFNHYIGTHLDISEHKKILETAMMQMQIESGESHSDGSGEDMY